MDDLDVALKCAHDSVMTKCTPNEDLQKKVEGYDFNRGINYNQLLQSFSTTGFQATNFGLAVDQINEMLSSREESFEDDSMETDEFIRRKSGCTMFLGYTSNMASSGVRETIRFLVQHRLVDCIVTSAGGIEEDVIKCLAPTYIGDFNLKGKDLREKGINRI
ncbi:putative deoxyhypusine synthase-like protein, partial [Leptotrombidium deliense]